MKALFLPLPHDMLIYFQLTFGLLQRKTCLTDSINQFKLLHFRDRRGAIPSRSSFPRPSLTLPPLPPPRNPAAGVNRAMHSLWGLSRLGEFFSTVFSPFLVEFISYVLFHFLTVRLNFLRGTFKNQSFCSCSARQFSHNHQPSSPKEHFLSLCLVTGFKGLQMQPTTSGHQSQPEDVVSLPVERRKFGHERSFFAV